MKTLFKGDIVQCIDNDFGKVWRHVRLPILYEFYTVSDTVYFQNEDLFTDGPITKFETFSGLEGQNLFPID